MNHTQKEVNYSAPINPLSYGIVGLNVFLQLRKAGVKVNWQPIGQPETDQKHHPALIESVNNDFSSTANSLKIFHEHAIAEHVGRGKHLGWPIFEVSKFNGLRRRHMSIQDEIIVCSKWAKDVCRQNGLTQPIHIVPLGVDTNIFYPTTVAKGNDLTFIHIGKREYRKGHYEMLKCFEKAFNPTDNVKLIMIWGSLLLQHRAPQEYKKWTDLYTKSKMAGKIQLVEWVESQEQVAQLLNSADCGLYLNKAEGFNLGCLESLACGLQNITMNYSGMTEFSNSSNSLMVEPTEFEPISDGVWFTEPDLGEWVSFGRDQEEQTINYMRDLYQRKMSGANLHNEAGVSTAKNFTWDEMGRKLLEVI